MEDKNSIIETFTGKVDELQYEIDNFKIINIRNFIVRPLIKSGIAIDYAFPFILAMMISASLTSIAKISPFSYDEVIERAKIETIDTSSGIHLESESYDFDYDDELIEYSTGWIINDKGMYERTVTSYRLNDEIDLDNIEGILSMSKEEIEDILIVTNVHTIKKNMLDPEDFIYEKDALIVVNHFESDENFIVKNQSFGEQLEDIIIWLGLSIVFGLCLSLIKGVFLKTYVRDSLGKLEARYKNITKAELEIMKKRLELRHENLAMLNNTLTNTDNCPCKVLRKSKINKGGDLDE